MEQPLAGVGYFLASFRLLCNRRFACGEPRADAPTRRSRQIGRGEGPAETQQQWSCQCSSTMVERWLLLPTTADRQRHDRLTREGH
jgi:hypothetical protein